jgi:hypothetical protein
MRKCLAKPRQNAEAILKTYELFIYGDIHSITEKFCKTALKGAKPYPWFTQCVVKNTSKSIYIHSAN